MKKILSLIVAVVVMFGLVGCGEKIPDVAVKDILAQMKEEIQIPMLQEFDLKSDDEFVKMYEINPEDLEEGIVYTSMINIKADEIIILKAKDKTKIPVLKEALEKEYTRQHNIWSTYLPHEFEKVENHILKTKGNYLIFVISENPENVAEIFEKVLK